MFRSFGFIINSLIGLNFVRLTPALLEINCIISSAIFNMSSLTREEHLLRILVISANVTIEIFSRLKSKYNSSLC